MEQGINIAWRTINNARQNPSLVNEFTPLKLQKLLFYIQGWYAANRGRRLIQEDFEAWQYGPVVPAVYRHFSGFGSDNLLDSSNNITVSTSPSPQLDQDILAVLQYYGRMTPFELVSRTHREQVWRDHYYVDGSHVMPYEEIRSAFLAKRLNAEWGNDFARDVPQTAIPNQ